MSQICQMQFTLITLLNQRTQLSSFRTLQDLIRRHVPLSSRAGGDDVFSDNVGHRFLMSVPMDKVSEILNEMFRFRRLLATPKSVNVEGGLEEMSSATAIHVVFHSVKRQRTKMELDMTLGWHEDQTSR